MSEESDLERWKSWVAHNLAIGCSSESLMPALTSAYSSEKALQLVDDANASPQLQVMKQLIEITKKREWLLNSLDQMYCRKNRYKIAKKSKTIPFDQFYKNYYCENLPVIFKNSISHWPAASWTLDSMKSKIGSALVEVQFGRSKDSKYEINRLKHTKTIPFDEYINLINSVESSNDYYMAAHNANKSRVAMKSLYQELGDIGDGYFNVSTHTETSFIWIGPKGAITPLHHDLSNHFFVQILGRKRFWLIPSMQVINCYDSYNVYSDVDIKNIDYDKFPQMRNTTILNVIVEPGDSLFLPIGWLHAVESLDSTVSVTITDLKVFNYYADRYPAPTSSY